MLLLKMSDIVTNITDVFTQQNIELAMSVANLKHLKKCFIFRRTADVQM